MPILTTPDLCFVLHNDDGKGGYKIGRGRKKRNVGTTNKKRERQKEPVKNETLFSVKSFVPKTSPDHCFGMTTFVSFFFYVFLNVHHSIDFFKLPT